MNVEIRGAGFVNKGAELMLLAIMQEIKQNLKDINFAIAPDLTHRTYERFSKLGFFQKAWLYRKGVQWGYYGAVIPCKLRKMYGVVLDSEIDVVLDTSGFAYSDQWGNRPTELAAQYVKRWKKQGTKIIFLPQAFGPFTSNKIKDAIKVITENANLIYARDQISYEHLIGVVGKCSNIQISPDFTNLLKGEIPEWFSPQNNEVCIIPNARMLDKTNSNISKGYIPFIKQCTDTIYSLGKKPFFLIHEGNRDYQIAKEISTSLNKNIPIFRENDAIRIKGIIGSSKAVISSRFHGLVSALSQGIPALGTGWSHKYQMLFEDYEFPEGILDIDSDFTEVGKTINLLFDIRERKFIINKLEKSGDLQKKIVKNMWTDIFSLMR